MSFSETIINGKWKLNLPDHRLKLWEGGWEEARLEALRSRISDGTVVYDIGSEENDMTALMATWGARMVSVEPSPYYWPRAKEVFEMNNVKPEYCYVGFASQVTDESNADFEMGEKDGWPLCAYGEGKEGFRHLAQETDATPQITIDDLVTRCLIPDILNIDVEGSCFEVLKGAFKILLEYSPEVFVSIHPEIMKEWYKTTPEDLYGYMEKLGYKKKFLGFAHEFHYHFFK